MTPGPSQPPTPPDILLIGLLVTHRSGMQRCYRVGFTHACVLRQLHVCMCVMFFIVCCSDYCDVYCREVGNGEEIKQVRSPRRIIIHISGAVLVTVLCLAAGQRCKQDQRTARNK